MKALTAMTLGAAMIGLAGFVYDTATADEPSCSDREAAIYFEKDKTGLNEFSKVVVERIAAEAKTCGATQVVAETNSDARAKAVSKAFEAHGLNVIVVTPPALPAAEEFVAGRLAQVRLTLNPYVG
jgi:hypothetical protein